MDTLHQIMLLCRPGFESECVAEMMDHAGAAGFAAYINAKPGTGYATLVSTQGHDTTGLISGIDFNDIPEIFDGPMIINIDDRINYNEECYIGIGVLRKIIAVVVFVENG